MFRNQKTSNSLLVLLYFIFSFPSALYVPLRGYMAEKYSVRILDELPSNFSDCNGRRFAVGYRPDMVTDEVRSRRFGL